MTRWRTQANEKREIVWTGEPVYSVAHGGTGWTPSLWLRFEMICLYAVAAFLAGLGLGSLIWR